MFLFYYQYSSLPRFHRIEVMGEFCRGPFKNGVVDNSRLEKGLREGKDLGHNLKTED